MKWLPDLCMTRSWRSTRRFSFVICRMILRVKFCRRGMLILATSNSAIHAPIALAEWCRLSIANTRKNGWALQARNISSGSLHMTIAESCFLKHRFSIIRGWVLSCRSWNAAMALRLSWLWLLLRWTRNAPRKSSWTRKLRNRKRNWSATFPSSKRFPQNTRQCTTLILIPNR